MTKMTKKQKKKADKAAKRINRTISSAYNLMTALHDKMGNRAPGRPYNPLTSSFAHEFVNLNDALRDYGFVLPELGISNEVGGLHGALYVVPLSESYTPKVLADEIGISPKTLRQWLRDHEYPLDEDGRYRIDPVMANEARVHFHKEEVSENGSNEEV